MKFRHVPGLLLMLVIVSTSFGAARADSADDRRRAMLAHVHRVVVIPAFFGTETLAKADTPVSDSHPADPKLKEYAEQLRKLETRARTLVLERLSARTTFEAVSSDEAAAALKMLDLTPEKLFGNNGRMRGTKFALPEKTAVHKLAEAVHADAALLVTLDEPRRSSDHYYFDPLAGVGFSAAHVRAKIGFWLLLADGTEAFQRVSEVLHPATKIGTRQFLFQDWLEADDLAIENFYDELVRYTPRK